MQKLIRRFMAAALEREESGRTGVVLVLGNYRQTLVTVRSLHRAGYLVILGCSKIEPAIAKLSRDVDEVWDHPPFSEEKAFVGALKRFLAARPDTMVLPLGDSNSALLAKHHGDLPGGHLCMPSPDTILHCLNKRRMNDTASAAGVPVPQSLAVRGYAEMLGALQTVKLPWAVKPAESTAAVLSKKAIFIERVCDIDRHFAVWPHHIAELLVQRKIHGLRYNVDFAAQSGTVICMCHSKILRVDTNDYSGFSVDSLSISLNSKIANYAQAVVQALGYTGIGLMQFLHDPQEDDYYFLELNPRMGAVAAAAYYVGLDLPRYAVELAGSGQMLLRHKQSELQSGLRCDWMVGDLSGFLHAVAADELGFRQSIYWIYGLVRSFLAADCHCTWQLRDPLPTLAAFYELVGPHALRRMRPTKSAAALTLSQP